MQDFLNLTFVLSWPLICCFFYLKLDIVTATFIAIVGGFLILPVGVGVNPPLIPFIDKSVISSIAAIIGILFIKKQKIYWIGKGKLFNIGILTITLIPIINVFFNTSPIFNGDYWVAGLTLHEGISGLIKSYIGILPLVIGFSVISGKEDIEKLYKLLIIALILYLPLALLELLISPQLHNYIYGFHPHSFKQQIRAGGFRAVVFTGHGLLTANIYLGGFIALLALYKLKSYLFSKSTHIGITVVFFISLFLLKSVTALAIGLLAVLMVLSFPIKLKAICFKFLVGLVCVYPIFAYFHLVPFEFVSSTLENVTSVDRIESLLFRLENEHILMEFLDPNLLFGNGGNGRAVLFGSIVDSTWAVMTMKYGLIFWVIHICMFSSSLLQINIQSVNSKHTIITLSSLTALMLIDQLVNSSLTHPWLWLYAGSLAALSFTRSNLNTNE